MVKLHLLILCPSSAALGAPGEAPSYRGARVLCSEHIVGNLAHISWTSIATKDDVATVVAFYEKSLGKKAGTGDKGERTLEARQGSSGLHLSGLEERRLPALRNQAGQGREDRHLELSGDPPCRLIAGPMLQTVIRTAKRAEKQRAALRRARRPPR